MVPMAIGMPYGSNIIDGLRSAAIAANCSGSLTVRISLQIIQNWAWCLCHLRWTRTIRIAMIAPTIVETTNAYSVVVLQTHAPTPASSLTSPAPIPPMAYAGSNNASPTTVPRTLYIRPSKPAYGENATLYTQPEMIIGKVIQFGT